MSAQGGMRLGRHAPLIKRLESRRHVAATAPIADADRATFDFYHAPKRIGRFDAAASEFVLNFCRSHRAI